MRPLTQLLLTSFFVLNLSGIVFAQDQEKPERSKQALSQDGYDHTAPAIVKIVSDAGSRIGTGAIVGVHRDPKTNENIGFILTSYSMVAGRDKVAVLLKNHAGGLLGHVVDKWIDFDLDVAIVAVRNFPPGQPVITIGQPKVTESGNIFTAITHTDAGNWVPTPTELNSIDEKHMIFNVAEGASLEGAPLVDKDGVMLGLFVGDETMSSGEMPLASAVRSIAFKPIMKEWFQPIKLQQKWQEQGAGIATWIWAVGGGVVGGTIATVLAIAGGEDGAGGPRGLPGPPNPPPQPTGQ
ncbi:MAG: hypothetical protein ACE5IY_07970 [bacterium]